MKNPHEDHGVGADNQLELVVVPGDPEDIVKKIYRTQLALWGSKTFSGKALIDNVIAELGEVEFSDEEQGKIVEDYKRKIVVNWHGRKKTAGTKAIAAYVQGLVYQEARVPTKKLVRDALLTVGKDEETRLIYANKTNIRDAVEYINAKKALTDHRHEKTIKAFRAVLREMDQEKLEFVGDLFPDV